MTGLHIPEYGQAPRPTREAYDAACRALAEHKKRLFTVEASFEDFRGRVAALAEYASTVDPLWEGRIRRVLDGADPKYWPTSERTTR